MQFLRLVVIGSIIGVGASTFLKLAAASPTPCSYVYRHDSTLSTPSDSIAVEVAKTDAARNIGLGGRACIGGNQGMLFEFDKSGYYPFWMKDMKFPIDIIWINSNHTVVTIKPDVAPSTYPRNFTNSAPAQYVLELQAGRARTLNLTQGSNIQFNP